MVQIHRVLFPTDYSECSLHALPHAIHFAKLHGAELHVLSVVDEAYQYWMAMGPGALPIGPAPDEVTTHARTAMKQFVETNLASIDLTLKTEVVIGRPFMEIVRYAKEQTIDLIVLGTHGHSGLRHALLGSVAERVVRKSPCPVLTIQSPEHDAQSP